MSVSIEITANNWFASVWIDDVMWCHTTAPDDVWKLQVAVSKLNAMRAEQETLELAQVA